MTKPNPLDDPAYRKSPPVFYECGCCGEYHHRDLPGTVDCRDNAHRFTVDALDAHYGPAKWEEITLEEQMSHDEDGPQETDQP